MSAGSNTGFMAVAVIRAADAMLRALSNDSMVMVFPYATLPNDPSAQLGLADPGVKQVIFSPVVVRTLATSKTGPRRRLEFLISSSAIAMQLPPLNMASANDMFNGALGILYDNEMFHIESVTPEYFGGTTYLYRVQAVE